MPVNDNATNIFVALKEKQLFYNFTCVLNLAISSESCEKG